MRRKWVFIAPAALAAIVLFIFVGGEVVRLLWNWLLPPLFGWRELTFWQALGLLVLCRVLFGGFGGHRAYRPGVRGRIADRMADRMAERWDRMTPEERERFRQRMGGRWDCGPWDRMTPEERERFRQRMGERWDFGPPAGESKAQ